MWDLTYVEIVWVGAVVGVGYDFQLIEEVPAARHDKRLGYIVTNRGITKAKMD